MSSRQRLKAAFQLVAWDLTTAAAGASIGSILAAVILLPAPWQLLLAGTLIGGASGAVAAAGVGRLATAWRRQLEKTGLGEEARDALSLIVPTAASTLTALIGGSALASSGIAPPGIFIFLGLTAWAGAMWGSVFGVDRPERPSPEPPSKALKHDSQLRR